MAEKLDDIVKTIGDASKLFKEQSEMMMKGSLALNNSTKTDSDDKKDSKDSKKDAKSKDDKKDKDKPKPENKVQVNSNSSGDDCQEEKFTYVTKSGRTAHVFNVEEKGDKVEFDAAFEMQDSQKE